MLLVPVSEYECPVDGLDVDGAFEFTVPLDTPLCVDVLGALLSSDCTSVDLKSSTSKLLSVALYYLILVAIASKSLDKLVKLFFKVFAAPLALIPS